MKRDDNEVRSRLTRRGFIARSSKLGAGIALSPLLLDLSCSSDRDVDAKDEGKPDSGKSPMKADAGGKPAPERDSGREPDPIADAAPAPSGDAIDAGAVLLGLYAGDGKKALESAVSRLDFSWLGKGDSVLIKVASNSGYPHPAVTSPNAVRAMVAHLKSLGAGRVIVADQAGVEHVRLSAVGRHSSTRERWMENGLIAVEDDTEVHFFDDQGFEEGYFAATTPEGHRWPRSMYLANAVTEVDHIVYMPRIAAHMLAGLTLGHKMAIGFLRDDSRHDLHNDAGEFYEKYAEINYTDEISSRFRMAVTVCEKIMLHGGPDLGTVYEMSPALVVASTRLANHDALASSILVTLNQQVPNGGTGMQYSSAFASFANSAFAGGVQVGIGDAGQWISDSPSSTYTAHTFEQGLSGERALARGWELSGGRPDNIDIVLDGEPIAQALKTGLETHGEGLYRFA